jgi:hypothetical protein
MLSLSPVEVSFILSEAQKENSTIGDWYLYYGNPYRSNSYLIDNSILHNDTQTSGIMSFQNKVKLTTFTYIKDKALEEIVKTYEERASVLAKEMALEVAIDLAHSTEAADLEKSVLQDEMASAIEKIKNAQPFIEKLNDYFKDSNLNSNEQYTVVASGILASAVYMQIKDNKGFKAIIGKSQSIIKDIKEIHDKAREFVALTSALGKHMNSTAESGNKLVEGLQGTQKDLAEVGRAIKRSMGKSSDIHSRRLADFYYKQLIKGEKATEDSKISILDRPVRINENLSKSIAASGEVADNLSNLLQTTDKMFNLLKINPPASVQKTIQNAQTVAAAVSTVKSITAGLATGGALGAITALTTSPLVASAMGAMNGPDAVSAELKRMDGKLDSIIENQKKIMEAQLETMNMVKDLALMVDQYHQVQMMALAGLRDISLVNMEINKAMLHKDIRSCERLINFQLSSVWKDRNFKMNSLHGVSELKYVNARFTANINGLDALRRTIRSVEGNGFERCQNGITEAFGGNSVFENPLRSIFSSSENEQLYVFQRDTYAPLLEALYNFAGTSRFKQVPLHLPSSNLFGVDEKHEYLKGAIHSGQSGMYQLEELISARGLERYLGQLLVLYPFFEVDRAVWFESHDEIVKTYLNNSNIGENQNTRSFYFLSNALGLVQSAIAQESILAGEPLIPYLYRERPFDLFSSARCSELKSEGIGDACAFIKNKLLMKNYFTYAILKMKTPEALRQYINAYNTNDTVLLASSIRHDIGGSRISGREINGRLMYHLKLADEAGRPIEVRLPTPDELDSGAMLYSENMQRLMKMQGAVIEALEKVAPVERKKSRA